MGLARRGYLDAALTGYLAQPGFTGRIASTLETRLGRLGRTSFTLEHRVTASESARGRARLVATAEDTLVLYDYATERPRVIPDELIARMETYEGRPLRG